MINGVSPGERTAQKRRSVDSGVDLAKSGNAPNRTPRKSLRNRSLRSEPRIGDTDRRSNRLLATNMCPPFATRLELLLTCTTNPGWREIEISARRSNRGPYPVALAYCAHVDFQNFSDSLWSPEHPLRLIDGIRSAHIDN